VGALGIAALIFLWLGTTAVAAELTARVDRDHLSVGETLQLVVELHSDEGGLRTPDLDFDFGGDFDVVGRATGHNMQWINGRTSVTTNVTYRLRPTRAGNLTIPGLSLTYRGDRLTTAPITVTVGDVPRPPSEPTPGTVTNPDESEPLFLLMSLSKESAMVGEPLTATLYVYTRLDLRDIDFVTPPDFPGFWVDDLASPRNIRLQRAVWGGVPYNRALLLSRLITPNAAGTITIPATVMDVTYRPPRRARSSDPFARLFTRPAVKRIASEPVTVTVRPLPEAGKPPGFSGAVGRFQLNAALDRDSSVVNEPVKLVLTVQGTGNFRGLSAPLLSLPDGLGAFDTQEECDLAPSPEGNRGSCTYTYLVVPRRAGDFTLPAMELWYFEPASGRYRRLATPSYTLVVQAGESAAAGGATAVGRRGVELLRKEIRYLMADDALRAPATTPWVTRRLFWLLIILPPAAYLVWGATVVGLRVAGRESAAGRRRRAYRTAVATLGATTDTKGVSQGVETFLSEIIGRPARGLRRGELATALTAHGQPPAAVDELIAVLDACDAAEFTPDKGDGASLADRARACIERLGAAALVLLLCLPGTAPAAPPGGGNAIATARQAYEAQDYDRALANYRAVLATGESAPRHYNAGCAAYQTGLLGEAIYHWSRALYLDPTLEDAAANLETARLAAADEVKPEDIPTLSWLATHLDALAILALVVWWALALALLITLRRPRGRRDGPVLATVVLGAATMAAAALLAFGYHQHRTFSLSVIVADEVAVRSGPGETFPQVFTLHAGAPTTTLATQGQWLRVRLGDRLVGWVSERDAALVRAPWHTR
jgi:tetratricopeptide (TPR) repeat protein